MTNPPACLMSPRETEQLRQMARGKLVLELGTWYGETTIELARVATRVWTVDHHQGDAHLGAHFTWAPYLAHLHNEGLQDRVVSVVGRFKDVLHELRGGYFHVVFVDGAHDVDSVRYDCGQATRLVRESGVIAVHDWGRYDVTEGASSVFGDPDQVVDSLAWWSNPRW